MDRCEQIQESLSELLDGELPAEQRDAVEAHLRDCADCREEYDLLREAVGVVSSLPRHQAPPSILDAVRKEIQADTGSGRARNVVAASFRPRPQERSWRKGLISIAATLMVGVLVVLAVNPPLGDTEISVAPRSAKRAKRATLSAKPDTLEKAKAAPTMAQPAEDAKPVEVEEAAEAGDAVQAFMLKKKPEMPGGAAVRESKREAGEAFGRKAAVGADTPSEASLRGATDKSAAYGKREEKEGERATATRRSRSKGEKPGLSTGGVKSKKKADTTTAAPKPTRSVPPAKAALREEAPRRPFKAAPPPTPAAPAAPAEKAEQAVRQAPESKRPAKPADIEVAKVVKADAPVPQNEVRKKQSKAEGGELKEGESGNAKSEEKVALDPAKPKTDRRARNLAKRAKTRSPDMEAERERKEPVARPVIAREQNRGAGDRGMAGLGGGGGGRPDAKKEVAESKPVTIRTRDIAGTIRNLENLLRARGGRLVSGVSDVKRLAKELKNRKDGALDGRPRDAARTARTQMGEEDLDDEAEAQQGDQMRVAEAKRNLNKALSAANARGTRRLITISVPASQKEQFLKELARLQLWGYLRGKVAGKKGKKVPSSKPPQPKEAGGVAALADAESTGKTAAKKPRPGGRLNAAATADPLEQIVIELIAE